MKTSNIKKRKLGGLSTPSIVIPIAVVLAILHAIIIVVISVIGGSSSQMTTLITDYESYSSEATGIVRRSSVLSETASTFCLNPTMGGGEQTNTGPLMGYMESFYNDELNGKVVLAHFDTYEVGEEIIEKISVATTCVEKMISAQSHAISLVLYDHPLPVNENNQVVPPLLAGLPKYELSASEISATPEQRKEKAFELLYEVEYSKNKSEVSQNVEAAVIALRNEMQQKSAEQLAKFTIVRRTLWTTTLLTIVILLGSFFLFLTQLISPLSKFAKGISTGQEVNEKTGMSEVRLLATTYNDLLQQKAFLEGSLRHAAETDTLTHLPNRFCFENQYLTKENEKGYSAAVFFFDINYLKTVNDTYGHTAGDALLIKAADAISASFLKEGENNCFRVGGDEFAAVLTGCDEEEIKNILNDFELEQEKKFVSVAVGYAYTPDIATSSFRKLFADADKQMYSAKIIAHSRK